MIYFSSSTVGFPGAKGSCVPVRESCFPGPRNSFPGAEEKSHSFIIKGKCVGCPGAEKQLSWRRGKVTFTHYGRKMCRVSWRQGKLCPGSGQEVSRGRGSCVPAPGKLLPGAEEKSHSSIIKRKCVGGPGAEKQFFGAGERSRSLTINEKCVGFPGAGEAVSLRPESCFPALRKSHIHSLSKENV